MERFYKGDVRMKLKDVKNLKDLELFEDISFAENPNFNLFYCVMIWKNIAKKLAKAIDEVVK